MKIVHVQTNISAIFGLMDDEGNILTKQPLNLEVTKLSQDAFIEAFNQIVASKKNLDKQVSDNQKQNDNEVPTLT